MGSWAAYVGGAVAAAAVSVGVYSNLPARFLLPGRAAELQHLAATALKKLDGTGTTFSMEFGAPRIDKFPLRPEFSPFVINCSFDSKRTTRVQSKKNKEAKSLSSLRPQLNAARVPLVAVVHQNIGSEVDDFRSFFDGDVFLDSERAFYGPQERWMSVWMGFLRVGFWRNLARAKGKSIDGNMVGEGRLLGGVYVIGKEGQGILLEHRELEWGDHVNPGDVIKAVQKIEH